MSKEYPAAPRKSKIAKTELETVDSKAKSVEPAHVREIQNNVSEHPYGHPYYGCALNPTNPLNQAGHSPISQPGYDSRYPHQSYDFLQDFYASAFYQLMWGAMMTMKSQREGKR